LKQILDLLIAPIPNLNVAETTANTHVLTTAQRYEHIVMSNRWTSHRSAMPTPIRYLEKHMKHTLIAAAATAAILALSSNAMAADGTINITGEVTATTCLINGSDPTLGAVDIPVDLPEVSVSSLRAAGERAGAKRYDVVLGGAGDTACVDGQVASMHFEATSPAIDAATGRLNNDTTLGNAENVQVAIKNLDGSEIDLRDSNNSQEVVIAGNTATLSYFAEYVATAPVTAGPVATRVQYSMVYN
jgi:major type 1 subunit fimbrin (pilin)